MALEEEDEEEEEGGQSAGRRPRRFDRPADWKRVKADRNEVVSLESCYDEGEDPLLARRKVRKARKEGRKSKGETYSKVRLNILHQPLATLHPLSHPGLQPLPNLLLTLSLTLALLKGESSLRGEGSKDPAERVDSCVDDFGFGCGEVCKQGYEWVEGG